MKQLIQNLSSGQTSLIECPVPSCGSKSVIIRSTHSLVSLGTEKMLVDFGESVGFNKSKTAT